MDDPHAGPHGCREMWLPLPLPWLLNGFSPTWILSPTQLALATVVTRWARVREKK